MIDGKKKRLFGLIGYPLSHSFSKSYFTDKFRKLGLSDHHYELFPLASIGELPELLARNPGLQGLNVTLPYKEEVLAYMDELSPEARAVGAVNTIRLSHGQKEGFNTDVHGFEQSLLSWAPPGELEKGRALVLGTGGASKAVCHVLAKREISYDRVSRTSGKGELTYKELDGLDWSSVRLIVNTTPLGMYPAEDQCPDLPYHRLGPDHYLMDLVYNPGKPLFLQKGEKRGSAILNGLDMLHEQAEEAWKIWNA